MKLSKEIITGVITLAAVALLIAGVNFLKGNSFFGGDKEYYAYFQTSGGVTPSTSVYVNGVDVGKVMAIKYLPNATDSTKRVKFTFNISTENLKLVKGSTVEAGGIDLLTKGLIIHMNPDYSAGYFEPGSTLQGKVSVDMMTQVQAYADPITKKLQGALVSIDNMVQGVSAFWDTTATSELEASMKEIKLAIRKFGNAADQIEGLLTDERIRLSRIMNNVEEITLNLRKSNDTVKAIIGNVKLITDDLVTANFKETISQATQTIKHVNKILDEAAAGNGTLGKLLTDDKLYYDIIESNQALQNLVKDLTAHPERYIHFSLFGAKSKGIKMTADQEEKLKKLLER